MTSQSQAFGRMKAFAYVTAEKAPLYRTIMRVFMESKERFSVYLRPQEVLSAVQAHGQAVGLSEINSALEQLCEWGNLATLPDASEVRTVEDFYKQHYLLQITDSGEAAERALGLFQRTSGHDGELQSAALTDIRRLLFELQQLAREDEPDAGEIDRGMLTLRLRFDELASSAQAFMAGVQRKIDFELAQADEFTSSTQRLIDYMDRFISELVIASEDIADRIRDIEQFGLEKLLRAAAVRRLADGVETTPQGLARLLEEWRGDWGRLASWFVSLPGRPSTAETLRRRARASMPAMLSVLTSINDRRTSRIDRSNDFRTLARWFAEAESDSDAHRLWRSIFGMSSSRHLTVNDATLDQHESQDLPTDASWLDTPPLLISRRFRANGSFSRTGRLSRIVDRTAEKKMLAEAARHEAIRILDAQSRFAGGGRMRLSEFNQLEAGELDLFLDLLGEALAAKVFAGDDAEIMSNNGSLRVTLEPTADGRTAVIHTPDGVFSGPDHWISIGPSSVEEFAL